MPRNLTQELKQLPPFEPPPEGWRAVQARLGRPSVYHPVAWRHGGLAAAVLLVLGGLAWQAASWQAKPPAKQAWPAAMSDDQDFTELASINELVQRSQQLEAILELLPSRPAVERAATSATIDELQSSIQLVDVRLTDLIKGGPNPTNQQQLWNTRVALLDSLVHVRYAEAAWRGGLSIDSGVI